MISKLTRKFVHAWAKQLPDICQMQPPRENELNGASKNLYSFIVIKGRYDDAKKKDYMLQNHEVKQIIIVTEC